MICKQRDVQPLFCISAPGSSGYAYKLRNMQTNAIQREAQRSVTIKELVAEKSRRFSTWLDTRSEFYSAIAGFSVTRRLVARINLVTLCFIVCAVAVEQAPLVALSSMACAAWIVYRLNRKGGRK